MDIKKYTEANRHSWNEVTPIHQKARKVNLKDEFKKPGFSTLDNVITSKLKELAIDGKRVAQLCCNNGRETLSLVNTGAESAVGFDISDETIKEANELAEISKLNCRFVRTDVYDIGEEYFNQFDLIYISIGALYWLPDLTRFFKISANMLKSKGSLVTYESHPFTNMLAMEVDKEFDKKDPAKIIFTYFREEPWISNDGIDYIGKTTYKSKTNYGWAYKLSDIMNAIIKGGLVIKEFYEYAHDTSTDFKNLEKDGRLPLSYILIADKIE